MQTQDAPAEIIFKLWPWFEANKNRLIALAVAVVAGLAVLFFISSQKEQKEIDAGQALTQLLVTPQAAANVGQMADALAQFAAKYPGTAAGQRAQLQAGAALFGAGRYADAQAQFQKFLDASATGPLAATAQLGIAASFEAQGKFKEAAAAYQKVVSSFSGSTSMLPAEFALGRIAEQQGQLTEAARHYESAARASLGGSLASEAAMRAMEIKARLASASKPAGKS